MYRCNFEPPDRIDYIIGAYLDIFDRIIIFNHPCIRFMNAENKIKMEKMKMKKCAIQINLDTEK